MRAVVEDQHGGPEVLEISEVPIPTLKPGQVLIRVKAAGLNRADTLQRRGLYPPPSGASNIYGLEVAGIVEKIADDVDPALLGQGRVALLAGGGYAQYVAVDANHSLPLPAGHSFAQAAGLIEVAATVYSNLVLTCGLSTELAENQGKSALVHGGSGGIGLHAIGLLQNLGVKVFTTAGQAEKCVYLQSLGAEAINYRSQDFVEAVKAVSPEGVDYVLDMVGADYLEGNLRVLKPGGHLAIIAVSSGAVASINLGYMMTKRLSLHATTLRARTAVEKAEILAGVQEIVWPLLEKGLLASHLDRTFAFEQVQAAHAYFDSGQHRGKVVLTFD